jgi:hypothetical protein
LSGYSPYGSLIPEVPGTYHNIFFPITSAHANGQLTPDHTDPLTPAANFSPGDPDTSEYVQDAVDGFPMFWGDDFYKV